ncbi:MAG: methylated-DNA--[protein]-cysteine S-methyltransferase [Anaerolineae bacterium]|nr:methylated-DNA--[protein]-cysteine S-methyltransferase [Anaerolineae bacterium]
MDIRDQERFWQAVQDNDSSFDGQFVYAERAAGVYCRPGCTARVPNHDNVDFFRLPEAAERAGFRPCQHCRPQMMTAHDPQARLIQQVCHYLNDELESSPTLDDIGTRFSVSPYHLQRTFKRMVGVTPRQYSEWLRIGCLKQRLRNGENVTDALYNVGYGSSSRLYERSDATLGMTPATYSRGGEGMYIHYTIVECDLGLLLVGMTEKGICAVHLGRNKAELVESLHAEYPAATIDHNPVAMCDWVTQILEHLNGRRPHLDLPMDVRATAFEGLVWKELVNIPLGQIRTYSEIAAAIGHPRAISAVEEAIHANPTAVLVPCHRAIGDDGKPSRYYQGRAEFSRQTLLTNEQQIVKAQKG